MKRNFKLWNFALAALFAGTMASCTSESGFLNEPQQTQDAFMNLLTKAPEINAYSNGIHLNNLASYAASLEAGYDYNFPAEIQYAEDIEVPANAVKYTGNNQGSGTYYVEAGTYVNGEWNPGLKFDNNANLNVYVKSGAVVKNIGSNIASLNLYICEGAEFTISVQSMNNCVIYNAGKLTVEKTDGVKIQNIFNTGELYVGSTSDWGQTLQSGVGIYSKGGYVEFNSNDVSYNEWSYSHTLINGTIISDGIVKSNGKIKFQSNGHCDICHLISTDLIDIVDNNCTFGFVEGTDLRFDGRGLTLHPEGLIKMSGEINMPNSGCYIKTYNTGDETCRGLVECDKLSIHLTNDPMNQAFIGNIYLNVGTIYNQASSSNVSLSDSSLGSFVNKINSGVTVEPSCVADSSTEEPETPTDPTDPTDPEDPETPDTPEVVIPEIPDHVEVNLSVEEHLDYLATHLSIHVRANTDVEVFIPVPVENYVPTDDMEIVKKHLWEAEEEWLVHGGPNVLTYDINGTTVTLTVKFEEEGIRVKTDGIDENVIEYLKGLTGDGITFEIWNYYNDEMFGATMPEAIQGLRDFLGENIATVEFLDNEPSLYVNAFHYPYDENGKKIGDSETRNPNDCVVNIVDNQKNDYQDAKTDWFYNEAPFNELYYKDNQE